jgi:type I restriction enzyme, R subunit
VSTTPSPNFAYLAHHDARLVALATQAEEHFAGDPTVTVFKLRQFGEVLAQRAAAKVGLFVSTEEGQQQLIDRLWDRKVIGATQRTIFHDLRRVGNAAVHEEKGDHGEALHQLRMARELAIWFQRSFGNNRKFDPGPFLPPSEPRKAEASLHDELARLAGEVASHRKELEAAQRAAEAAKKAAEAEAAAKLTAEERAAKAREDAAIWEALANEQIEAHRATAQAEAKQRVAFEEQNKKLTAELAALQAAAVALPPKQLDLAIAQASAASEAIDLDEAATRKLIDRQLRDAGWEVDSQALTFGHGVRPTKGKNLAIAEWPTLADGKEGWADYVLFAGLQVVGVVEAKREHKDVMGVISQAKRYSLGYVVHGDEFAPEGSPWGAHKVPFLFATNGRPYLRQLLTKSGIWFLDARRKENHPSRSKVGTRPKASSTFSSRTSTKRTKAQARARPGGLRRDVGADGVAGAEERRRGRHHRGLHPAAGARVAAPAVRRARGQGSPADQEGAQAHDRPGEMARPDRHAGEARDRRGPGVVRDGAVQDRRRVCADEQGVRWEARRAAGRAGG